MADATEAEIHPTGGEAQPAPQHRGEGHAPAPNPEQHLQEAHKLSIRMQGKPGLAGYAVWALIREERGKTKTLRTFKGSHQQAVAHFYHYIHPAKEVAAAAPARRRAPAPRSQQPLQRSGSRPSGGPKK